MPNSSADKSFSEAHIVLNDGSVAFRCSADAGKWPWLALHPANNIVVQMVNYWCSVETGRARGALDPTKWSALTACRWRTFSTAPDAGHATHGIATGDPDGAGFNMVFFDAAGALAYHLSGEGVVFQNRDFEGWRAKAKEKAARLPEPTDFVYAPPEAVGVATPVESLVSPVFESEGARAVDALVTKDNAFAPGHPYHGGSGDHVNSGHLLDAVQQAARLLAGEEASVCAGGAARFKRYIELGRTFRIVETKTPGDGEMAFVLHQGAESCAEITMGFARP